MTTIDKLPRTITVYCEGENSCSSVQFINRKVTLKIVNDTLRTVIDISCVNLTTSSVSVLVWFRSSSKSNSTLNIPPPLLN